MNIAEQQHDFDIRYAAKPRSPGLHVSEIIRDVALDMGLLNKDDQEELDWTLAKYRALFGEDIRVDFPQCIYRVAFGLAWEQWYGGQNPQFNLHEIGELGKDGIIGTPDGLEFRDTVMPPGFDSCMWLPPSQGIIHEVKLTWKSSRDHSEEPQTRLAREWVWLAQIKAYCYMAHTPSAPVTTGMLHVFWVNGNYRGSGPQFRTYQIEFTEAELTANWRLLQKVAAHKGMHLS